MKKKSNGSITAPLGSWPWKKRSTGREWERKNYYILASNGEKATFRDRSFPPKFSLD